MSNIELKGLFIGSEWFGAQERTGEKNFVSTARFLSGDKIFQIFVNLLRALGYQSLHYGAE
jgi:hypothetical protein